MSGAGMHPAAARPSASELSENIGDVLASIRRLIAEDDASDASDAGNAHPGDASRADAADHPRPDLGTMPAAGASLGDIPDGSRRPRSQATAARRRAILAEAQALNRRPAAGPATDWQAAPPFAGTDAPGGCDATLSHNATTVLPLSPADRVAPCDAGATRRDVARRDADPARVAAQPPMLSGPSGEALDAAAFADMATSPAPVVNALPDLDMAAGTMAPVDPPATTSAAPPVTMPNHGAPMPPDVAPSGASAEPAADRGGRSQSLLAETTMTISPIAQARPAPTDQNDAQADPAQRDHMATDNSAESLLGTMIREVVRSELQTAGMARDLRAMILREVAQVLTEGARPGTAA